MCVCVCVCVCVYIYIIPSHMNKCSSTEKYIYICAGNAGTGNKRTSIFDEIKQDFYQVIAVSILLHNCTIRTLTRCLKMKDIQESPRGTVCYFE